MLIKGMLLNTYRGSSINIFSMPLIKTALVHILSKVSEPKLTIVLLASEFCNQVSVNGQVNIMPT
jgi:hypothetical protein